MRTGSKYIRALFAAKARAHRDTPCNTLGKSDYIGFLAEIVAGKEFARSADTRLYFIGDRQHITLGAKLKYCVNELLLQRHNAALARGIGDNQEALRAWYGYTMDLLNGKIDIDTWGKMHQENQMGHFAEVLAASKINPSDLDNPANEATGK